MANEPQKKKGRPSCNSPGGGAAPSAGGVGTNNKATSPGSSPAGGGLSRAALRRLYLDLHDPIEHFMTQRLGAEAAPGATQDVFLRALAYRAGFHPEQRASAEAWIWSIARHVVVDRLRSRRRRGVAEPSTEVEPSTFEEELGELEESTEMQQALDELPEPDREILIARFWHGRTYGDMADELGLTEAAVTMRVRRAIQRLRSTLTDE